MATSPVEEMELTMKNHFSSFLGPNFWISLWLNLSAGLWRYCMILLITIAEARLAPEGRLKAFDVDPQAVEVARQLEQEDSRHLAALS